MMERILLGVFCLSGWHILSSSCLPRQYHYVADPMNWTEAQNYCRENYADLATIENTEDMNRLINTVVPNMTNFQNLESWIGLYTNINWTWSDSYRGTGAEYRNWATSEPNFNVGDQLCVNMNTGNAQWSDNECFRTFPFICSRGRDADSNFVFVNESMNWSSAQRYCRENFTDLATVRNDAENQEIYNLIPSGVYAWIDFHRSGKWKLLSCKERLTFFCNSIPPVTRQIVKLRVKRGDPSVDLNDPAVKADILKKLQKELQDKGISGVNLKWREQPDGKVFHKEGETPQKKKSRKKTEL